jgi:tetratricopeptide (TPR) repeat protein
MYAFEKMASDSLRLKLCFFHKETALKHIKTTATAIRKIKAKAKLIKAHQNILLSHAQDISAKESGYENFHHASKCASDTQASKDKLVIDTLILDYKYYPNTVCFSCTDIKKLDDVTTQLDEVMEQYSDGFGDMETMGDLALNIVIHLCKHFTEYEPAFIDGYAHWVGALTTLGYGNEAVSVGLPVYNAAIELLKDAPKDSDINYYDLKNRPFYRFAHNLVLALYKDGQNNLAKKIAKKMIKFNPNDNTGFRFLLEPIED